jgi:hypothetical protein
LDADTDDDGLQDGYEFFINTNPLFADLDNDGDGVRWFNDCDDNDSSISPYKTEVRNGIDDNCNNEIDEGIEPLAPKILVVSIDYSQQAIEQPIQIITYANQDTLEIIYEFEPGLVIEIQQNNAIINSVNEGTFGGSVCAIADVTIDCQQFTFTFVEVEEDVVEPSEKQDPKQSASYLSQVSQHFLFIAIGTVILLAIVAIGWERKKTVQQWQAIPPQYVGNVPAAPDLSILNKGFDNR